MTKNPSDTWFYNDWENDPELKTCTLAAQGLWMRLLCIAARSPERGVVQIGDLTCSLPDGLAHIALAVGRPLEEIVPLIDELLSSRAASLDRKRRIINRRMVRAAKTSEARSQSGRNGASVTNGKRWKKRDLDQQTVGKTVGKKSASSRLRSSSSFRGETTGSDSLADEPIDSAREPVSPAPKPSAGRAQPIPPGWEPSEAARDQLRISRPDLSDETIALRMVAFHAWCASNAKTTFNPDATWLGFMVQTHAQRTRNSRQQPADEDDPITAGIRESLARRHILAGR